MSSSGPCNQRVVLGVIAATLGGCMKIYPDSELPDIELVWDTLECREGTGDVRVTLTNVDEASVRTELVACTAGELVLTDVDRVRYRVESSLLRTDGSVFATSYVEEIDLRDGLTEHLYAYFSGFENVRVDWQIEGGTCDSIGATSIDIAVDRADLGPLGEISTWCEAGVWFYRFDPGTYTLQLRARSESATKAVAEPLTFELAEAFVDLGTVVLVPCTDCD